MSCSEYFKAMYKGEEIAFYFIPSLKDVHEVARYAYVAQEPGKIPNYIGVKVPPDVTPELHELRIMFVDLHDKKGFDRKGYHDGMSYRLKAGFLILSDTVRYGFRIWKEIDTQNGAE